MLPLGISTAAAVAAVEDDPLEEERRRRRKISNRESARRSRMRKQKRLEELRAEVSQMGCLKGNLVSRLADTVQKCVIVRRENERLRLEHALLVRRLAELKQELMLWQKQRIVAPLAPAACAGVVNSGEPNWAPLITRLSCMTPTYY